MFCTERFGKDGKFMDLELHENRPASHSAAAERYGLARDAEGGCTPEAGTKELAKGVMVGTPVDLVVSPEKYSYTKVNIRRNIYRVPIG
jgi:hypothetical protein